MTQRSRGLKFVTMENWHKTPLWWVAVLLGSLKSLWVALIKVMLHLYYYS